jgi:hypothetical protein
LLLVEPYQLRLVFVCWKCRSKPLRWGSGADRLAGSCPSFCRAYDDAGPVGVDGGGLGRIFLRSRGHHSGAVQQASKTLAGARYDNASLRHFIYYIEGHIELDGDSHGPMGQELLEGLVAGSPEKDERALPPRATASRRGSIFGMAH